MSEEPLKKKLRQAQLCFESSTSSEPKNCDLGLLQVEDESSATASQSQKHGFIEVLSEPFQPDSKFQFPKRSFGQRERPAQLQWFEKFKWLHYDLQTDSVLRHLCHRPTCFKEKKFKTGRKLDMVFIRTGFTNWKKDFKPC